MHVHTNILHIISTGYISDLTCSCLSVLGFRWAAAAGQVSLNGMILPAALYFWQIPHFMALAYLCRDDYAAGGYAPNYILYFECMKLNAMSMLYHIPCCQSPIWLYRKNSSARDVFSHVLCKLLPYVL